MTHYSNVLVIEGRKRGPDFVSKIPIGNGWLEVGVAYFNPKTKSFTVYLDAVPVKGKIVLFRSD
ncbi:MAG: hypothetical protein UW92_C0014G0004 [Candidatus Jorgensenbacteria bacterium GW2011_GWA2_45_13]|uniref:Uncharacterized protein n=1 Tax=Candidatus Jorgensenbacteria bacterium GW2011_GWA2_45_13 TaxID=1618662 RepID=A0A0G1P4G2_9BACT|nr:MAG: hypothetical protein UW92_C0014G0004 [Candidatus Jorgensenbacteria bacterium GW2011_GWA2_45_13]HIG98256.1 hypothetical protein [Candidatus Woesearchaeota archaeon]